MIQEQRLPELSLEPNPLWYKDAIIYELHVRAFSDSNEDGIGDFNGLISKLDYLQDLGVTAIWLLPFYPSPLRDGGYDIADYTDINPCYGTRRDFGRLLKEAHRRGLRVITELVLNHTSSEHEWFQRSRRAPVGSKWRNFYVWSDHAGRYKDARIIFKDFETSNWTWDPVAKAYYWHRFYSHQPDLNFDNPHVHEAITRVVDFWLEMGVDGLRLDAVPYLYERENTSCENLPETHAFLKKLRSHIDRKFSERMLLAEANQWPSDAAAYFGEGDECHMNFHFPLMPRMFMSVQIEDSYPIINILKQTPQIPENCQWATFLRNHDELTLEMVTDEDRDYMYRVYADERTARINLGIRRRLAPLMKLRRRIELMNALLFSLPGTPVLYYGDEIGMGDNIYLGDRDGVRTPMQWSADRNAGFSRCNPQRLYLPVIIDPEYHYESVNVEAQQKNPASLLWWMKRLIALRKQYQVFGRGSIEFLHPENSKVLAFLRIWGEQRVLVVVNLSRYGQYVELDLSRFAGMVPVELFGRTRFPAIGNHPYFLSLGPHDFFWFSLEPAVTEINLSAPPSLRVRRSWQELLLQEKGRKSLEPLLRRYISGRRWFRGKARNQKDLSIIDVLPVGKGGGLKGAEKYLLFVRIEYTHGAPETYVVPVGFATGEWAGKLQSQHQGAIIASLTVEESEQSVLEGVLYDASVSSELADTLLWAMRHRLMTSGLKGQLQSTLFKLLKSIPPTEPLPARFLDVEQSNTTIIYGDKLILKLYRLVEEGINPELEIGRFLTEQGFKAAPRLAGTIGYRGPSGEPMAVVLLQELIPNEGDAWKSTLESLDQFFERVLSDEEIKGGEAPPLPTGALPAQARQEIPSKIRQLLGNALFRAEILGQRTAELHQALGREGTRNPAFGREPFNLMHQQSLFQSVYALMSRTFDLLRRSQGKLPEAVRERAVALLAREEELRERLKEISSRTIEAARIRCHGDLHLGQVLVSGDDFVIIDFEGEPARPLSERRYRRTGLRDVAGMLRSFRYAAQSALRQGRVRPEDVPALSAWSEAWAAWVSAAYLGGYFRTIRKEPLTGGGRLASERRPLPLIPEREEDIALLLDFSLLEKCIYEIGYELNNRPDWLEIPLFGLEQLLERRA